jgi:hypothetical protein
MLGYFQELIAARLEAGRCSSEEAEIFSATLSSLPEETRNELRSTLEQHPQLVDLLFENILLKAGAITADTLEEWQRVVDAEAKKADALETAD